MHLYVYTHTHTYICMYIYIYRDVDIDICVCIYRHISPKKGVVQVLHSKFSARKQHARLPSTIGAAGSGLCSSSDYSDPWADRESRAPNRVFRNYQIVESRTPKKAPKP